MIKWLILKRQELLSWLFSKLIEVPLNPSKPLWDMEDKKNLAKFLSSELGRKLQQELVCAIHFEAKHSCWVGTPWSCGFAKGFEVMLGRILAISANVPQSKDDSKSDATQVAHRISQNYT